MWFDLIVCLCVCVYVLVLRDRLMFVGEEVVRFISLCNSRSLDFVVLSPILVDINLCFNCSF